MKSSLTLFKEKLGLDLEQLRKAGQRNRLRRKLLTFSGLSVLTIEELAYFIVDWTGAVCSFGWFLIAMKKDLLL